MTACPGCGRLVHADQLNALAQVAREATQRGDLATALGAWREALVLLPDGSRQQQVIAAKITELGQQVSAGKAAPPNGSNTPKSLGSKIASGAGAVGLALWKLKTLLLGLTKASTLFSMLLSLGVYCAIFGWQFALGLVLSIYVHEMGHVITLRRYGFKATAPMFIPGFGALIRLQQQIVNPEEDAEIGLAGPIYGFGAALVAALLFLLTKKPIFAAIAGVGAWINLFNLLPVYTLDGGRGFHAMSRLQKFLCAGVVAGAWYFSQDGLLILLALVCAYRAFKDVPRPVIGWKAAITYIALVIALTSVSLLRPATHPTNNRASDNATHSSTDAGNDDSDNGR